MYYIVRVYDGETYEKDFLDLGEAEAFMAETDAFCELYLWRAGREEYMGSNREN